MFLPWEDPCFLTNLDVRDASSSNDEIRICIRDIIAHDGRSARILPEVPALFRDILVGGPSEQMVFSR